MQLKICSENHFSNVFPDNETFMDNKPYQETPLNFRHYCESECGQKPKTENSCKYLTSTPPNDSRHNELLYEIRLI